MVKFLKDPNVIISLQLDKHAAVHSFGSGVKWIKIRHFHYCRCHEGMKLILFDIIFNIPMQASEGAATSFEGMLLSPLIHYRKAYCHEMLSYLEAQKPTMQSVAEHVMILVRSSNAQLDAAGQTCLKLLEQFEAKHEPDLRGSFASNLHHNQHCCNSLYH